MSSVKGSLLISTSGEGSVIGGITIEGQAITRLPQRKIRKTLQIVLADLEKDMMSEVRRKKGKGKKK